MTTNADDQEAHPGRIQIHVWLDEDVAEWLRTEAFHRRTSRGKTVEGFLRAIRAGQTAGSSTMRVP